MHAMRWCVGEQLLIVITFLVQSCASSSKTHPKGSAAGIQEGSSCSQAGYANVAQLDDKRKVGEYIEQLSLSPSEQRQFAMEMEVIKRNLESEQSHVKYVVKIIPFDFLPSKWSGCTDYFGRAVEAQMTEIAQLQDLFANKLVEHGEVISNIHDAVMHAVSHVESGNKQLRDANSASDFRLFMALFFFTAGLALLFVHWYE